MIGERISEWPLAQNWIFIFFLVCFLINVYVFVTRKKLFETMIYSLFHEKNRESIFIESVNHEFASRLLLCLQTIILLTLFVYKVFLHKGLFVFERAGGLFVFLGTVSVFLLFFILIKFLLNNIFGNIFFDRENVRRWNESLFSILSLTGVVLFLPLLLLFYVDLAYFICYYFVVIFFVFLFFLTIYKIYEIFFSHKIFFHYFILYLCTLEIVPLFLIYKAFFYLFTSMQKGTLWLQI